MIKSFSSAFLGSLVGFLIWFGFTALTGIWLSLLGFIVGVSVAGFLILFNKPNIHEKLTQYRIIGTLFSLLTVMISEYQINRFMFAKSGEIELSDFPIIPESFEMFLSLFLSTTSWQPILGILLAVIACNALLKDWAN